LPRVLNRPPRKVCLASRAAKITMRRNTRVFLPSRCAHGGRLSIARPNEMKARRIADFVLENSILLIAGTLGGLAWANLSPGTYEWFHGIRLYAPGATPPEASASGLTLPFFVNDILMAFFFGLAGKEVWESLLPGGQLRDVRRAPLPVVSALGGMMGPALIYSTGALLLGRFAAIGRGWAIPCATDVAFSYMIARLVFGRRHPATPFLLLLAIADDAFGLIVIALFYPQKAFQPVWLLLAVAAVLLGFSMRRLRVKSFWWYIAVPGALSWSGFALSGIHPALGLLPVIPTLPHARTADAVMHWGPTGGKDALERFEGFWKKPVEVILALFGLVNAGVALSAAGATTYLVLTGLIFGKPAGITLTAAFCVAFLGLKLPKGLLWKELFTLGCAAGIGFTVALFVATVAFPRGAVQDASKMGALASCIAAPIAFAVGKLMGVRRLTEGHGG